MLAQTIRVNSGGGSSSNQGCYPGEVDRGLSEDAAAAKQQESTTAPSVKPSCTTAPNSSSTSNNASALEFNGDFESGNIGKVDCISEHEYDIAIRSDTNNDRQKVWFYFSVKNVKKNQRVIFNITNFSKTKTLYREGASPVVKSAARDEWQRIPSQHCFYYKSPRHKRGYVLSFLFKFDNPEDEYFFAYSFPYTYTQLQNYLDTLESKNRSFFKRQLLGYSVQNRRLDMITITSVPPDAPKQRTIVLTGRVHPGESPSSWVCQGIIDFLTSDDPKAQKLRKSLVFKIVPMLNPDGVFLGNYRSSSLGYDLNRNWQNPTSDQQPTILLTKNELVAYKHDSKMSLDFYIDIHAHSTLMNGFMYGNVHENDEVFQDQKVFPLLLDEKIRDFSFRNTSFNADIVKAGTGRRTLGAFLDKDSKCYTLEVSFFQQKDPYTREVHPYTIDKYMELGRNIVLTFLDYYF